jgi:hypothetical protein
MQLAAMPSMMTNWPRSPSASSTTSAVRAPEHAGVPLKALRLFKGAGVGHNHVIDPPDLSDLPDGRLDHIGAAYSVSIREVRLMAAGASDARPRRVASPFRPSRQVLAEIVRRYDAGEPLRVIGEAVGCSTSTVWSTSASGTRAACSRTGALAEDDYRRG